MNKKLFNLCAAALIYAIPAAAQVDKSTTDTLTTDVYEIPEGFLEDTDAIIAEWNKSGFFQLDTTSQLANVNPYFDDGVYQERLSRIPAVMDLRYNDVVRSYIDRYVARGRKTVSMCLGASNFYMPIIEEALAYHQLPYELKYLPMIESAFNPTARSHAGAVGLWQFMPGTGRQYGLIMNSLIDERRDPIKSSFAAARLLKDLYQMFGDWTLVIAAYNCGPGNVNKAIHRAGGERDFWKIYQYLPRETRNYVPAFIAANYAMNYYADHNIYPMRASYSATTDTIMVSQDIAMETISRICNIDMQQLRILNPQYSTSRIPGRSVPCTVRMPQKELLAFIDAQDSIYAASTLTDQSQLADDDSSALDEQGPARTTYRDKSTSSRSSKGNHGSKSSRGGKTVTVKRGQTLSEIARRNGTTVAKLRKLNGISGNNIRAGRKLRVK